ncbi:MAG: DUF4270 family protein [Bacteroidales bacterium]|nr:DUF4270 family protein [Bacteroidales bacterium]MBN2698533.1 DUF4270 family protein [Bacteroidales bacterium]
MKPVLRGILFKSLLPYMLSILAGFFYFGCTPDENELGRDLLPAGDNIFVFYDTLDNLSTSTITGKPVLISENPYNPQTSRLFLLGNMRDTLSGFSKADIVTQFNAASGFTYGPNMTVDSLILYLYFTETVMKKISPLNIKIYEFTEPIYMDSVYYTDYDITGKIGMNPIAEKTVLPLDSTVYEFVITYQGFINKFINPPVDTLFKSDSLFKEYFNGLYITTDDVSEGGFLSKIQLANSLTKLSIKYANDSTGVDSIPGLNYVWSTFTIDAYSSQKINIFQHDYAGTAIAPILNNPDSQSPVMYVQGMTGLNTKIQLRNVENWMDSGPLAINSAKLIFEVLPESLSGISYDDLPDRLILYTDLGDKGTEPLYDYVIDQAAYDGRLKAVSEGVFFDTTYQYSFNIGLHYQNLISGKIENRDLVLQPYDQKISNKMVKLWSNFYPTQGGLRLKIVYTKL